MVLLVKIHLLYRCNNALFINLFSDKLLQPAPHSLYLTVFGSNTDVTPKTLSRDFVAQLYRATKLQV